MILFVTVWCVPRETQDDGRGIGEYEKINGAHSLHKVTNDHTNVQNRFTAIEGVVDVGDHLICVHGRLMDT